LLSLLAVFGSKALMNQAMLLKSDSMIGGMWIA